MVARVVRAQALYPGPKTSATREQCRILGGNHEAVAHLDEKERQVITLRFGLDGDEPRTLQEIGEQLGESASVAALVPMVGSPPTT